MLVLLLPALLAPSGWSLHLCFCEAAQAQAEDVVPCCRVEEPSCCAPRERTSTDGDGCAACHRFDAAHHGLQPNPGTPAAERALAPIELASWLAAPPTQPAPTSVSAGTQRGPAPPGPAAPLPLRI